MYYLHAVHDVIYDNKTNSNFDENYLRSPASSDVKPLSGSSSSVPFTPVYELQATVTVCGLADIFENHKPAQRISQRMSRD